MRARWFRLALGACLVCATTAPVPAQVDWMRAVIGGLTGEAVAGLLDLPELARTVCGNAASGVVQVYQTPVLSNPVGEIRYVVESRTPDGDQCEGARWRLFRGDGRAEDVPGEEHDYEVASLVVYERRGQWYRVALQRGSAWVHHDASTDFHDVVALVRGGLAYVRAGWDGRLVTTPGGRVVVNIPVPWRPLLKDDVGVQVLRARWLDRSLWLEVEIRTEMCGEPRLDGGPVRGWIPAHRAGGAPAVWFYSRGC